MLLDINLQPQRSSSNKLDLEWIQEYIKCKIKLSITLVLILNAVQSLSGSLFGFIIYAALNPNQSFNPFTVDPAEQLTSTEEKSNDSSSFKSANGSLKFYLDDPCNN